MTAQYAHEGCGPQVMGWLAMAGRHHQRHGRGRHRGGFGGPFGFGGPGGPSAGAAGARGAATSAPRCWRCSPRSRATATS